MDRTMNTADEARTFQPECRSCILGQALRTAREAGLAGGRPVAPGLRTAHWMP